MARLAKILGILALAVLAAAAIAIGWLTQTESGLRWALERAVIASKGQLAIDAPRGSLANGVQVARLSYAAEALRIEATNVVIAVDVQALAGLILRLPLVAAESLDVVMKGSADPATRPDSIGLPVTLHVEAAKFGVVRIAQDATRVELRAATFAYFGSAKGHALRKLAFDAPGDSHVRADAILLAKPPYGLTASAAGEGKYRDLPWKLAGSAVGSLDALKIEAAAESNGAKAQLEALVAAFDRVPVKRAALQVSELDASRFNAKAPKTAIEAKLVLDPAAAGLAGTLGMTNALAGDSAAGRLPLERATAHVSWKDEVLNIDSLDAQGGGASVRGALEVRGKRITTTELVATARGGELRFAGAVTLDDALPFEGKARFAHFDPSAFGPFPAGSVSGEADVSGKARAPLEIDARFALQSSTLRGAPLSGGGHFAWTPARIVAEKLKLALGENNFSADGALGLDKDVMRMTFDMRAPLLIDSRLNGRLAGSAEFSGALDGTTTRMKLDLQAQDLVVSEVKIDEARVNASGTTAKHEFTATARSGEISIALAAAGGMKDKKWKGTIDRFRFGGRVPAQLVGSMPLQSDGDMVQAGPGQLALLDSVVDIANFEMRDAKLVATRGSFRGLALSQLMALADRKLPGRATLKVSGDWALEGGASRTGTFNVRRESGDVILGESDELALGIETLALDARLANGNIDGTLRFQSKRAAGNVEARISALADNSFAGTSPIAMKGTMQIADIAPFGAFLGTQARIGGRATGALAALGTIAKPALKGEVEVRALEVSMPPEGVNWRDGNLKLVFSDDETVATSFSVKAGEGIFTAEGRLAYDDEARSSLEWTATKFTVISRPTLRVIASGKGTAALEKKRLALMGDITVDSARIEGIASELPQPGSDVVIVGAKARDDKARKKIPVKLEAKIDLGRDFSMHYGGLETQLRGKLQLESNSSSELVARGQVFSSRGTYTAFGQRLAIERGVLYFDGPVENPVLDIQAMRRNQTVAAGVTVGGNLRAPVVRLVSEPSVPETEALFWLVLGRAPEDRSGSADLGMLTIAATALLGDGRTLPTQALFAQLGIDSVELRGGTSAQSQVVAVGKRISDRLYVTYEQGLSTAQTVLRLEYLINNRFTVRADAGQTSRLGVNYRYSFD